MSVFIDPHLLIAFPQGPCIIAPAPRGKNSQKFIITSGKRRYLSILSSKIAILTGAGHTDFLPREKY
jgi:hypothetical protein